MKCKVCGKEFESLHWSPDGERLCDECFYKDYGYCIVCDGPYPKEELKEIKGLKD